MTSFISTNVVKQQSLKESSFVTSERAQIKSKTYEMRLAYLTSRLFSRSLTLRLVFPCVFLFSRLWTYSSTKESCITKHFSQCIYNKARDALSNITDSFADVSSNSFSAACQGMNTLAPDEFIKTCQKWDSNPRLHT